MVVNNVEANQLCLEGKRLLSFGVMETFKSTSNGRMSVPKPDWRDVALDFVV